MGIEHYHVSSASIILPIIIGILYYRRLTKELKLILGLCGIGLLFEGVFYGIQPSLPSSVFYLPNYLWYTIEFAILMQLFRTWSKNNKYLTIGVLFVVIHIVFCFMNGFSTFNSNSKILLAVVILVSVFILISKTMLRDDLPLTIIFAGLALFFSVNIIIWLTFGLDSFSIDAGTILSNNPGIADDRVKAIIADNKDKRISVYVIHSVFNILMNACFTAGFIFRNRFVVASKNSGVVSAADKLPPTISYFDEN